MDTKLIVWKHIAQYRRAAEDDNDVDGVHNALSNIQFALKSDPAYKAEFERLMPGRAREFETANLMEMSGKWPWLSDSEMESVARTLLPDFESVRDKRMSELSPAQRDDAMELWLREQIMFMPEYHRDHYRFLLARLDVARSLVSAS